MSYWLQEWISQSVSEMKSLVNSKRTRVFCQLLVLFLPRSVKGADNLISWGLGCVGKHERKSDIHEKNIAFHYLRSSEATCGKIYQGLDRREQPLCRQTKLRYQTDLFYAKYTHFFFLACQTAKLLSYQMRKFEIKIFLRSSDIAKNVLKVLSYKDFRMCLHLECGFPVMTHMNERLCDVIANRSLQSRSTRLILESSCQCKSNEDWPLEHRENRTTNWQTG